MPTRRQKLFLINKKKITYHPVGFAVPADLRVTRKDRQILGLCQKGENVVEHELYLENLKWYPRKWKNLVKWRSDEELGMF